MIELNNRQQKILGICLEKGPLSSSDVFEQLEKCGEKVSLVTIKRDLSEMESKGVLAVSGLGRGTTYETGVLGRLGANVDAKLYCAIEPDKRFGLKSFNFKLFESIPNEIFEPEEIKKMEEATLIYKKRSEGVSLAIQEKELERFIIELSWKSSKIEGNTYTLLDTERLIQKGEGAPGHDKSEAQMILNHKDAFKFIRDNSKNFINLTRVNLEETHKILVRGLNVNFGIRERLVGITGSTYQPLDNSHQIAEAVEELSASVSRMDSPYDKALVALLGISYIQPFEDGNKRTSRLMANAILLAHKLSPLSYRSMDENNYREAMMVFYEINAILPMKKIFIEQYDFSARNYSAS